MVSPLGPTFAAFYMATIENKVVPRHKHTIYTRYVDDIFVAMDTPEDVEKLKIDLENNSVLIHRLEYINPCNPLHSSFINFVHKSHTFFAIGWKCPHNVLSEFKLKFRQIWNSNFNVYYF